MDTFDTNIASLTYLTNPLYQQILKKKNDNKNNNNNNNISTNKEDIKFYRKRISSLTKDMLKDEIPDNNFVKNVYETYVNGLIKYFKMIDTTDIIQKQYVEVDNVENNVVVDNVVVDIKENNVEHNVKDINVNNSLLRKFNSINTLDNFVIKQNNAEDDVRIIPVILEVDLKEPSLKRKGVKNKNKNVVENKSVVDIDIDIDIDIVEKKI